MDRIKNVKKYNYFYKITNKLNNHFYYGIHMTHDLNDNYMGSGIRLNNAYKKYGLHNFEKEIISYFDNNSQAIKNPIKIVICTANIKNFLVRYFLK